MTVTDDPRVGTTHETSRPIGNHQGALGRFLDVLASLNRSRQTFEAVQALPCPVGHAVAGEPCWRLGERPALCGSRVYDWIEETTR